MAALFLTTPGLAAYFNLSGPQLALIIIGYGFVASVLPVWLLLAPRDYLSTFMKIGVITLLAIAIIIVHPDLQMPALTKYIDGSGPVWAGSLFPFLFITIACGSVSGWHALISSGTSPKMIENERQIPFIGYGAMLMVFVAIMAMISASVLHPCVYFAMNSSAGMIGTTVAQAAQTISTWGFVVTPDQLTQVAHDVGELRPCHARAAHRHSPSAWRASCRGFSAAAADGHLVSLRDPVRSVVHPDDRRRRHARLPVHDPGYRGNVVPAFKETKSWANNLIGSALACKSWGYFLYQGVIYLLGGIWTMWPLFGTSNQMLAAIALTLCTVVLFKMKRQRYAWVTIVPATWLVVCTVTAGLEKVLSRIPLSASSATRGSSALPSPMGRSWRRRRALGR